MANPSRLNKTKLQRALRAGFNFKQASELLGYAQPEGLHNALAAAGLTEWARQQRREGELRKLEAMIKEGGTNLRHALTRTASDGEFVDVDARFRLLLDAVLIGQPQEVRDQFKAMLTGEIDAPAEQD